MGGGIQGIPVRLGSHGSANGGWGGGLGLGEAPVGALQVSKPRTGITGEGQSSQLGGSDLGVVGWGWGLDLRQLSPDHTSLLKRFGSPLSAGLGSGSLGPVAGVDGAAIADLMGFGF